MQCMFFCIFPSPASLPEYRVVYAGIDASAYVTRYPVANTLLKEGVFVFWKG